MTVRFLDLGVTHAGIRAELDAAIAGVVDRSSFVLGHEVEAFEHEFAEYAGARHCIGVGNGLDALHLALRALGVGEGDEVIVPGHTFVATWLAVTFAGATPVPVDVDPATGNLDASAVAVAVTARTRAVVPVHLYGQPADLDALVDVSTAHGLLLVADAAQAHGARYRNRQVGASVTSTWSFYPGKNLGALGDAGAVTTDDDDLADRLRVLRNYGSRVKYEHESLGFNSRLDELQAAVLRVKLRHLDAWNRRRAEVAEAYTAALSKELVTPHVPDWAGPSWHLYAVRHPDRDLLRKRLAESGVETLVHYPVPPHRQAAYAELAGAVLPVTEQIAAEVLSLPMGPHLTDDDIATVVAAVREALAR